ncbi:MAG: YbaB/EbfC family nucleoid-associated protein [Ruminococcus sp.]|nr:YbaB/EbfC family nucleoid-associated protein [Ruminococcus sp.]
MKARLPKQNQGGAQSMNAMIRQAQKMQDEISELQEDIEARSFTSTSGGGAVTVTVSGKKTIQSLEIKPEVVDPEDIDMLQDLIISAVNEAINQVEEVTETEMSKVTGGVSLPDLF